MSEIALIVGMGNNRVIGKDNQIPWHLSADLQYFKKTTLGKPVVMGRRTYESIGKPLPGRHNIVITRNQQWAVDGVSVAHSLDDALQLAADEKPSEMMIIGGSHLYTEALPRAQRLYVTHVDIDVAGDTFFPQWDQHVWHEVSRESHQKDDKNPFDYCFCVYERT